MRVSEIIVSAGRTFNHPHESYSNLRPVVTLKATLDEAEDAQAAVKQLQASAEKLVEDHKQNLLESLNRLYEAEQVGSQIDDLERQLTAAQSRLDALRTRRLQLES